MITNDLQPFRDAINRITHSLMKHQPRFDNLGLDRDDHESILLAHAWETLMKWRRDPARRAQGILAERKYVYRALWNRAYRTYKSRKHPNANVNLVSIRDSDLVEEDTEERLMVRHQLDRVSKSFTDNEWDAVCFYLETGNFGGTTRRRRVLRAQNKVVKNLEQSLITL